MCALENRRLRNSTLLVIGATGDVGSGCVRCLAGSMRRVVLCARNVDRLRKLAAELNAQGVQTEIATDLEQLQSEADIVICAASMTSPSLLSGRIAPDALVCDAGYPKNVSADMAIPNATVFFWSSGRITRPIGFCPGFSRNPQSPSVRQCGARMSAGGDGAQPGTAIRTILTRKRIDHTGASRRDGNDCRAPRHLPRAALQPRRSARA